MLEQVQHVKESIAPSTPWWQIITSVCAALTGLIGAIVALIKVIKSRRKRRHTDVQKT